MLGKDSRNAPRERSRIYYFPNVWVTFSQSTYVFVVFGNDSRHAHRERSFIVFHMAWVYFPIIPTYSVCLVMIRCTRLASAHKFIVVLNVWVTCSQ